MNDRIILILLSLSISIFSCSSKKQILYLQNLDESNLYEYDYTDHKISVDDILKIEVSAEIPETAIIYNPGGIQTNISNSKEGLIYDGYQVNTEGNIYFPSLGKIRVVGLTTNELRDLLYDTIVKKAVLNNPFIDVKILNSHFTILGEVNIPGRHEFLRNNLNILQAIGIAGDLTINGRRDDVRLIRKGENGNLNTSYINLTNANDLLNSDFFQIMSGDVIIVNPNSTRVKNAGIIGNSGTLLTLLSFILSSIIVINN